MSTLYLVRHGETYWNKLNIMHGQCDVPLNDTGKCQAINVANELYNSHFDMCFSSPLQRAVYTAKEILKFHPDVPLYLDERLMELSKGKLEGTYNNSEAILKNESLDTLCQYNIESKAHFYKRVQSFYDDLLTNYPNKDILVVSHSGTVKMSMFYFNPPKNDLVAEYYNIHIPNCSVTTLPFIKPNSSPILKEYDIDRKEYPLI